MKMLNFAYPKLLHKKKPAYLRLGMSASYPQNSSISAINHILKSNDSKLTIIVLGPIIQNVLKAVAGLETVDVFTVLRMPLLELSIELEKNIANTRQVIVVQEHIERGGLGEHLLSIFAKKSISLIKFVSLHANEYPCNIFGNQAFHQEESGLDPDNIRIEILKLVQK